jgi:hypothetical protein
MVQNSMVDGMIEKAIVSAGDKIAMPMVRINQKSDPPGWPQPIIR